MKNFLKIMLWSSLILAGWHANMCTLYLIDGNWLFAVISIVCAIISIGTAVIFDYELQRFNKK